MLQRNPQFPHTYSDELGPSNSEQSSLDVDELLAAIRRQFRVMLATGLVAVGLGTAFIFTEIPEYTATADLLIEYRQITFLEDSYLPNPLAAFDGIVSSEIELLRSEAVARYVIDALDLRDDPRFLAEASSPISSFVSYVRRQLSRTPVTEGSADDRDRAAVARLRANLRVSRVGPAFILRVEYTAPDPALAAEIANGFAAGYLRDQRDRKFETMRQAGDWLRVRVIDLREKLAESELAVMSARRAASDDTALVALNALERETETFRNLHASFLQRYQEALHHQSVPAADARIINAAEPPAWTSYPPKLIVLALSVLVGGALGTGLGALFEYRDQGFRRGAQVRELLRLSFLGMLPKVRVSNWPLRLGRGHHPKAGGLDLPGPETRRAEGLLRHSIDKPTSSFCESLRSAAVAANLKFPERKIKVIGVTSVLKSEGRSTAAKNLASLLAARGSKTLLIDADLTNPGLSEALAPDAEVTLADVVLDGRSLREAVFFEAETGLAVLPASKTGALPRTSDLVSAPGFADLLLEATGRFDFVIVDLPPMADGMDASAAGNRVDAFICVIEWARTPRKLVQRALSVDHVVWEKCIGVIYNKVDAKRLRKYEGYSSEHHYQQRQKTGFRV